VFPYKLLPKLLLPFEYTPFTYHYHTQTVEYGGISTLIDKLVAVSNVLVDTFPIVVLIEYLAENISNIVNPASTYTVLE
jgi:hypothetical protein